MHVRRTQRPAVERPQRTGRARFFALAFAGLSPLLSGSGCSDNTGVVELSWVFVDRNGGVIYPGDQLSLDRRESSCDLPGQLGNGTSLPYDLRVELEICTAEDGAAGANECHENLTRRFPCDTARGTDPEVDAADHPYRFTVRAVMTRSDNDVECTELPADCIDVPGPRERRVQPGLVTDLQVYQIKINVDVGAGESSPRARLDLEECGCA